MIASDKSELLPLSVLDPYRVSGKGLGKKKVLPTLASQDGESEAGGPGSEAKTFFFPSPFPETQCCFKHNQRAQFGTNPARS